MLTPEEKRGLMRIARESIERILLEKSPIVSSVDGGVQRPGGAFVTIRVAGELRGCVGYVESPKPLSQVVAEVAGKAAFEDPRFSPLTLLEYQNSTLEISILSGLMELESPEEIEIGKHGLLVDSGGRKGVLLPQVAVEQGWDRRGFLDGLARKTGLKEISWNDGQTTVHAFTVDIISEGETPGA